ncbi:mitogen-activated protein kinase 2 [Powai lake megavirus]|uniref:Mitogen-activated protein kinase 2 n=1 Tax=Powai lake megavirus TaxID=1842663 RepID=A0A167RIC2_9VIRU|nr:mitogen-activated protein kinase 2 [Powai lake megavirus]ANB50719.1 mitogen-activated protein kinase 2 [Powai lake megavirus]
MVDVIDIDSVTFKKILSKKSNCTVYLVTINQKNHIIKYYDVYSKSMFIELNILASMHHKNIVDLKMMTDCQNKPTSMIMKCYDISLSDMIGNDSYNLDLKQIYYYLLQIAHGIRYLHYNNIIHFDIKPDNIMLNGNTCKIIDFGCSEYYFQEYILTNTIKCTTTHRPPEAFDYDSLLNTSVDIWSFGILMCELLSNQLMYRHEYFPVYNNTINYDCIVKKFIITPEFKNIVNILPISLQSCLDYNSHNRPCIDSVINILFDLYQDISSEIPIFDTCINNYKCINYNNLHISKDIIHDIIYQEETNGYHIASTYIKLDIAHRLSNIELDYLNIIIDICDLVFNNKSIKLPHNHKIINNIIISNKGILFQYYYYVYNMDTNNSSINAILNGKFINQCVNLLQWINEEI